MTGDAINALFELGGAVVVVLSIRRALEGGDIKGLSGWHVAFFTCWGAWNIFYYPTLDQWLSFGAGVVMTLANFTYAALWWKYNRLPTGRTKGGARGNSRPKLERNKG